MNVGISERIVSLLSYWTFGIFGLIWIVYVNLVKKTMSPFLTFNVYQSIFVAVILTALSYLYQIAVGFLSPLPFIGGLVIRFHNFFIGTPIYFGFTLSGMLLMLLLFYMTIIVLMGRKPYIPVISDAIYDVGR